MVRVLSLFVSGTTAFFLLKRELKTRPEVPKHYAQTALLGHRFSSGAEAPARIGGGLFPGMGRGVLTRS